MEQLRVGQTHNATDSTDTIAELTNSLYIARIYYAGISGTGLKQCPRGVRATSYVADPLTAQQHCAAA